MQDGLARIVTGEQVSCKEQTMVASLLRQSYPLPQLGEEESAQSGTATGDSRFADYTSASEFSEPKIKL